jgi:phage baseplate assembly protein V
MSALAKAVQAMQAPLLRRIRALSARAIIQALDDSGTLQKVVVTLLAGERISDVARLGHFGLASRPPAGSTAAFFGIGGSRTHGVIIAEEHTPSRMHLDQEGESALYNMAGDYVYVKQDGTIHVKASSKVFVEAPNAEFTGNVKIDGTLTVVGNITGQAALAMTGNITGAGTLLVQGAVSSATSIADPTGTMAGMRVTYNGHHHAGVQTGTGTSAVTDALMT